MNRPIPWKHGCLVLLGAWYLASASPGQVQAGGGKGGSVDLDPMMWFGPVPGFTTVPQRAPQPEAGEPDPVIVLPYGTEVPFEVRGLAAGELVQWDDSTDTGASRLVGNYQMGFKSVSGTVQPGGHRFQCDVVVLPLRPADLEFRRSVTTRSQEELGPGLDPAVATEKWFALGSAGRIHEVDGRLVASTGTPIVFSAAPALQALADRVPGLRAEELIEWRINGEPIGTGDVEQVLPGPGVQEISVGPPGFAQVFDITTYAVTVQDDLNGGEIHDGLPVTYTAVTDPPGYERYVTWFAATLHGTAEPMLGSGPSFTVTFDDTLGTVGQETPPPTEPRKRWIGVKGDSEAAQTDTLSVIRDFWWTGVQILPGQTAWFHEENVSYWGIWSWIWITFITQATVEIHVELAGDLHLPPGATFSKHVNSTIPFIDDEWFTNIGGANQTLLASVQADAGAPQIFNLPVGPGGTAHINASALADLWKDITNINLNTNWWDYLETVWASFTFFILESYHCHIHFEELIYQGIWIYITNTGVDPIVVDVHMTNEGLPH